MRATSCSSMIISSAASALICATVGRASVAIALGTSLLLESIDLLEGMKRSTHELIMSDDGFVLSSHQPVSGRHNLSTTSGSNGSTYGASTGGSSSVNVSRSLQLEASRILHRDKSLNTSVFDFGDDPVSHAASVSLTALGHESQAMENVTGLFVAVEAELFKAAEPERAKLFQSVSMLNIGSRLQTFSNRSMIWTAIAVLGTISVYHILHAILNAVTDPSSEPEHESASVVLSDSEDSLYQDPALLATTTVPPPKELLSTGVAESIGYAEEFVITAEEIGLHGPDRSFRWMLPEEAEAKGMFHAHSYPSARNTNWESCSRSPRKRFQLCETGSAPVFMEDGTWFDPILPPWSTSTLTTTLRKYGVPVSEWTDSMLRNLASQLSGENPRALLVETADGQVRRKVDLVLLIISHPESGLVLMHGDELHAASSQKDIQGRLMLQNSESLPSMRKRGNESILDAAQRCLDQKLLVPDGTVELNWAVVKSYDTVEADSYCPGLVTIVRRHFLQGRIVSTDPVKLSAIHAANLSCLREHESCGFETVWKGDSHHWIWQSLQGNPSVAEDLGWLNDRARRDVLHERRVDLKLQVIQAWSVAEVDALLSEHHIVKSKSNMTSTFGMSIEQLSEKASRGHVYFAKRGPDGNLGCIIGSVQIRIISPSGGAVLVETTSGQLQWPTGGRWLNEPVWDAAQRLLRVQLGLQDSIVYVGHESFDVPGAKLRSSRPWATCAGENVLEHSSVVLARIPPHAGHLAAAFHAADV